jgi:hypothetical protein
MMQKRRLDLKEFAATHDLHISLRAFSSELGLLERPVAFIKLVPTSPAA